MMDNFGQLTLKKHSSASYRPDSNNSTGSSILQLSIQQKPKPNNNNPNMLMIPKLTKQAISNDIDRKKQKKIYYGIEQNNINKFNHILSSNKYLGQNLTNSCYFNKKIQSNNNNLINIHKYHIQQANSFDIVINQPNKLLINNSPALTHQYSNNSKKYQRRSHIIGSNQPYQHFNYQQYNTNKQNNKYNLPYNDQSYRLRQTSTTNLKKYDSMFEKQNLKQCHTSRTSRPAYQKVRNSCIDGSTSSNYSKNKYLNTTFPYTSSQVSSNNNRQALMSESVGECRINERTTKNNGYLMKSSVSTNKIDTSNRSRSGSKSFIIKQPKLDDFIIGQCKGEGRFGKVYMVVHKNTGFLCALKKVKKQSVKYMIEQFIQQIKIQLFLNHPKLVKLYGYFSDQQHFYMLIQYMEDGSLYSLMKKNKKIDQNQTVEKLRQICQGIKQMHDNNIVHRDLKPENVVMTHGVCKICDFGWATICQDRRQTYCGTLDYVCPEIIEGNSYNSGVDVWCIGVLAYQLMCGKAPFYDISRKKTMQKIKSCKIQNFPSHLSIEAIRFIQMILTKDPDNRTGIQELLDSEFLKSGQK